MADSIVGRAIAGGGADMSRADDLLAEGLPEAEYHTGIASRLPRKRVAAGAIFRDEDGRLLMLQTLYKPCLEIPGGIANDNESPLETCIREINEELGIAPPIGGLLVVDWVPRHGVWPDGILFVFDGGVLSQEYLCKIQLQESEILCYKFLALDEVIPNVRPGMARRLQACITAINSGGPLYLQFGRLA
jgi:8-oxo-dGTP pyrophosphatase MutT (NUDIX family)